MPCLRRARQPPAADEPPAPPPAQVLTRYGLTDRELTVLRLLAAGRTNPQIGARPACTSATSCASSASPAGSRPRPWPNVPACWSLAARSSHKEVHRRTDDPLIAQDAVMAQAVSDMQACTWPSRRQARAEPERHPSSFWCIC